MTAEKRVALIVTEGHTVRHDTVVDQDKATGADITIPRFYRPNERLEVSYRDAEYLVTAGHAVFASDGDADLLANRATDPARLVTIEVASDRSITPARGTYLKPGTRLQVPAYEAAQLVESGHAVRVADEDQSSQLQLSTTDHVVEAPVGICGKPVGQPVGVVIVPAKAEVAENKESEATDASAYPHRS